MRNQGHYNQYKSLTLSKSDVQKTNDKIIQMTGGTCFGSSLMQCTMVGFANFPSGGFTKIIQMTGGTCFRSSLMHCTLMGLTSFPSGRFIRLYEWQWGIWQCLGTLLMQCTVMGLTSFLSDGFTIAGWKIDGYHHCAVVMLMLQLWSWYLKLEKMVTAAHCPFLFGINSITKVRSLVEHSCTIPFKIVVIFNVISADVVLKLTIILKEMKCHATVFQKWTDFNRKRVFSSFCWKLKI